ncbi:hypothetical protein P280DRAFT_20852 [Massarina eburnea CBS 473.64]|uniref:Uncharacterized protein n=1 Tax=Massarina eburnea CBS 473.64 TaxID=1395130 RepID=A0A6A6SL32_9PLEO|nr:hypothetical protein P280DRAFT_20852 [Massarina eburnea CBS 473.64]
MHAWFSWDTTRRFHGVRATKKSERLPRNAFLDGPEWIYFFLGSWEDLLVRVSSSHLLLPSFVSGSEVTNESLFILFVFKLLLTVLVGFPSPPTY